MAFAWKFLFPLSLVNLFAVALEAYLLRDPNTGALTRADLWIMAPINLALMAGSMALFHRFVREKVTPPRKAAAPGVAAAREAS
jgi:hypothetical protein